MKKRKQPSKKSLIIVSAALAAVILCFLVFWASRQTAADKAMGERLTALLASNTLPQFVNPSGVEVSKNRLSGIFYKPVVFSVANGNSRPNDIYAARVRLSGSVVLVKRLKNLSNTPDADESVFTVGGGRVAWANSFRGKFRSVSTVKLSGKNLIFFKFEREAKEVRMLWEEKDILSVFWKEGSAAKKSLLSSKNGSVIPADAGFVLAARVTGEEHWFSSLVNYVRGITGPEFISRLEELFFDVKDWFDGVMYKLGRAPVFSSWNYEKAELPVLEPFIKDGKMPGEGVWSAEGMPKGDKKKGPLMARACIRPDEKRPYAVVNLLYLDLARAEIRPVAGTIHPISTTGIKGPGAIPEDDDTRSRLLCGFAGGFQAVHGGYGMMVDGDVYIPALPGIATACFFADGSMKIGVWDKDGGDSPSLVSYRQNLPPLIIDGKYNSGNTFWGYTPKVMQSAYTWRTGMGLTKDGKLIYAIGNSVIAETLAKAMTAAGVITGMQLDMNISNVMCEIYSVEKSAAGRPVVKPALFCKGLVHQEGLYLRPQTRDFFYVLRKKIQ